MLRMRGRAGTSYRYKASLISVYFPDPIGYDEEEKWAAAQEWAVPTLRRLRSAIEPVLDDYMRQPGV